MLLKEKKSIKIEDVLVAFKKNNKITSKDEELIKKAYKFAEICHKRQKRLTGEPYIIHPLAVAYYLAQFKMDAKTISAGLLHDAPEDSDCTQEDIEKNFGEEISILVEGVTRLGGVKYFGKRGRVEDLRKLLIIMAKDLRVVIIKLADRLHNIQTLDVLSPAKRRKIAQETIEIYAPLASRLGMGEMKGILEDISFKYYLPKDYKELLSLIGEESKEREKYTKEVISSLKKKLHRAKIKANIEGRVKHLYSLFKKLKKYNNDFSKIYDLIAVRVVVNSISDCYKVLGIVHKDWKPLIKRIKDYIAVPKPNGYRSLHTTVFCLDGKIIEIQIRTKEMHEEAEWGIAGHHVYEVEREGGYITQKLSWIGQLVEWQKDLESSAFMEGLKIDVLKKRIFVFTPKGEAMDLPEGATPIDFAYQVHTYIGNSCVGCKVNNKIVPLDTSLSNGDVVEILTSKKNIGPSRDWLRYVKTPLALYSIRKWFKSEDRGQDILLGKDILNEELKKIGKSADKIPQKDLDKYLKKIRAPYSDLEGVFLAVARGMIIPKQIISGLFLTDEKIKVKKQGFLKRFLPFLKGKPKVLIEGEENLLINFASCCKPKPPYAIIGFVTRGKGITIHKKSCPNIIKADKNRLVKASWEGDLFEVPIYIEAESNVNILKSLTGLLEDFSVDVNNIQLKAGKNTKITAKLKLKDKDQLKDIFEKITSLEGVKLVKRT